jgi:hypothetical protein
MTSTQKAEVEAKEQIGIIPDSSEVFGKRAAIFDNIVEERTQMKAVMKGLEEELKVLDKKIETFLADTPSKTVLSNGARVTQCQNPGQSKLSKELLIEHGVAATVIAECTVPGKAYSYILVSPPKAQK